MSEHDDDDGEKSNKDPKVEAAKQFINSYRSNYRNINPEVLFKLSELKEITAQPKQEKPDASAMLIAQYLDFEGTAGETLRQERWRGLVKCPYCKATHVKRLALEEQKSKEIYKYRCLDCKKTFNDDSETKIEEGVPPLRTWMLCWYLLGCTSSVQYIAAKLGLNIKTVELMIQHLQRLFNTQEPLKHFLPFDEWYITHGKGFKTAMQDALAKQVEKFRGFSVGQEKDTAEVRRQKNAAKPKPKF